MPSLSVRHAAALASLGLLLACSSASTSSATHSPDGGTKTAADGGTKTATPDGGDASTAIAPPLSLPAPTANITWAPNTTFIDQSQLTLVKSSDATTGAVTLDSAGVKSAGLDLSTGRIVVIYGQMMGSITSSTDDGAGTLTLATSATSLDQAATAAELDWQMATELTPDAAKAAGATLGARTVRKKGAVVSQNNLSLSLTQSGYTYGVNMVLAGDQATVDLTIDKSLAKGAKGHFGATGTIKRFVSQNHVSITGGKLQKYTNANPNVQGNLTLVVSAAADASDALSFTLPIPLFQYVTLVGPIPVVMTIGAQFVMNGQMPVDGSVQVSSSFDYDSTLGFTYDGTSVSATASIGSPTIQKSGTPQSAASSAVAFSAGMGFPRVAVNLFGLPVVGWLQPAFVVGGSYTFMPACQTADAELLAACGYSISVLGISGPSGSLTLFDQKETLLASGMCPPGS